jgi:predicted metal-dependent HD superfamily phosphohydrolase
VTGRADASALASRWRELAARVPLTPGAAEQVGDHLLVAWSEPHRRYHDLRHLAEVLDHVDELAQLARDPDAVRLAAWFHDVRHDGGPDDEERSARAAESLLASAGAPPPTVHEMARLVRLTATHDPAADDVDGAVLCDADLAVLARDPAGYRAYAEDVRAEYAHVPDGDFRAGRAAVLSALVAQPRLFRTDEGAGRWEAAARRNVASELAELAGRRTG